MKETIYFFIRGIAGHPSDQQEWEYRAADHVHIHTPHKARAISYATSFLTVWKRRHWRALRFSKVLRKYTCRDWKVVIVAHSEGTVVALDGMRLAGWPRIDELHLICGACDSDFQRTGLNFALRTGGVGHIHCYIAGNDNAMLWERLVLGKLLFGIPERSQPLGLHGPRNVDQQYTSRVTEHWNTPWTNYGHSTCWDGEHLESTMNQIIGPIPQFH